MCFLDKSQVSEILKQSGNIIIYTHVKFVFNLFLYDANRLNSDYTDTTKLLNISNVMHISCQVVIVQNLQPKGREFESTYVLVFCIFFTFIRFV